MTDDLLSHRVHILPLGFEYERAIAALMSMHAADRAVLLVGTLGRDPEFTKRQNAYTKHAGPMKHRICSASGSSRSSATRSAGCLSNADRSNATAK